MDIEKLKRCLKCCADDNSKACNKCELEYGEEECQNLCGYAATALSTLQAENEKLRDELEQVKKKNKYSAHDVSLILSDVFGDSCACNFNGNDEWLPEKCELLDTCPDVVGVACWEQYLKWRDQKEE